MRSFRTPGRRVLVCAVAGAVLAAAACAPEQDETGAPEPTASRNAACRKADLPTVTPGRLTIATDQPAYEPWFVDDDPSNGKGFEGAVAYAVAEELGFAKDEVTWTRVRFNNAIQPGPKDFDFDINQFTINDKRRQAVDFSSPYYQATQAVIALNSSSIADADSLADLKDARLGAQVNTTSYDVITEVIRPGPQPQVYPSNDNAKQALQNGSIDGLVVDLPTAFYMTSAEIEDSTIVGQVEQKSGAAEEFGLVLDKGSPLTRCVSQAVDALRADGTLTRLEERWLSDVADAPMLK